MWSGPIVWSQPWRSASPLTVRTLDPMPSMPAPMLHEHAREILDVRLARGVADDGQPGRARGGQQRVLGRHHRRLVHEHVAGAQAVGATSSMSRLCSTVAPERLERVEMRVQAPPADDVAAGRRHADAPEAREQRAGEQERGADALGRARGRARRPGRGRRRRATTSCSDEPVDPHAERLEQRRASPATSPIFGTLRTTTSSSVRTEAARMGRAPFLLPAGTIVPDSAMPPSMTNFSMSGRLPATGAGPEGWARVTAMPSADFARRGLVPAHGVGLVAVAAPPLPRGRGRDAGLRRARRPRRRAVERHRPAARRRLRALPRHGRRRARPSADDHGRARAPRRAAGDGPRDRRRTPTSSASRRSRRWRRTLVAVDELCGFLVACAQVRPEGIHGLTPKSVKKKLKQPSFAAAVNREEVRDGADALGVDFDEHVALRHRRARGARRRARAARPHDAAVGGRSRRGAAPPRANGTHHAPWQSRCKIACKRSSGGGWMSFLARSVLPAGYRVRTHVRDPGHLHLAALATGRGAPARIRLPRGQPGHTPVAAAGPRCAAPRRASPSSPPRGGATVAAAGRPVATTGGVPDARLGPGARRT